MFTLGVPSLYASEHAFGFDIDLFGTGCHPLADPHALRGGGESGGDWDGDASA